MTSTFIDQLNKNKALRNNVIVWLMKKGYHKRYKVCNAGLSSSCIGVGLSDTFHGRKCGECRKKIKKLEYAESKQK